MDWIAWSTTTRQRRGSDGPRYFPLRRYEMLKNRCIDILLLINRLLALKSVDPSAERA